MLFIDGHVMKRNFCHPVAPSTEAASYCSAGILKRAATKINVQKGSDFQICISMDKLKAKVGSLSQLGPSRPVHRKIKLLIIPHSGLSMNRTDKMVGMEGTAQGNIKIADAILIHQRWLMKKPDNARASIIFKLIATIKKTNVLTALRKKIGSLKRSM